MQNVNYSVYSRDELQKTNYNHDNGLQQPTRSVRRRLFADDEATTTNKLSKQLNDTNINDMLNNSEDYQLLLQQLAPVSNPRIDAWMERQELLRQIDATYVRLVYV